MAKKRNITIKDISRNNKSISFYNVGFKDYLGARVLLNSELILQGAILASTCIEKYFKAIISIFGQEVKGHLKDAHINAIRNCDRKLYDSLNLSFLKLLIAVYKLRYLDDQIKPGFSIHICDKQLLAELDYSIHEISKRIVYRNEKGVIETPYHTSLTNKDPLLFKNNYILNGLSKTEFIEQENSVYVNYSDNDFNLLEIYYKSLDIKNDGEYLKPGLIRNN